MMCKAAAMGDTDMYVRFSDTESPADAKRLGRAVSNFNKSLWDKVVCSVAYDVLYEKFSQNHLAGRKPKSTGQDILVEASKSDYTWGAGMAIDDPDIVHPRKWKGSNILGWALMQVRSTLIGSNNGTRVDPNESGGKGREEHCYKQLSLSRVRKYYLPPGWKGERWRHVSRVVHECCVTGDVVFDEDVTYQRRYDFDELWELPCNHPGGLRSLFYYTGEPLPSRKEANAAKTLKRLDRKRDYPDHVGAVSVCHKLTLWKLNEDNLSQTPSRYYPTINHLTNMRLNKSFSRMEPTGSLQVQILADAGETTPVTMNDDATGFELKSVVEVRLGKGDVAYANLGMAFCPPRGSEILLCPAEKMQGKTWKVDGSRVASDITGEAMIPLRNIGLLTIVIPKGTVLARMLIENMEKLTDQMTIMTETGY